MLRLALRSFHKAATTANQHRRIVLLSGASSSDRQRNAGFSRGPAQTCRRNSGGYVGERYEPNVRRRVFWSRYLAACRFLCCRVCWSVATVGG